MGAHFGSRGSAERRARYDGAAKVHCLWIYTLGTIYHDIVIHDGDTCIRIRTFFHIHTYIYISIRWAAGGCKTGAFVLVINVLYERRPH